MSESTDNHFHHILKSENISTILSIIKSNGCVLNEIPGFLEGIEINDDINVILFAMKHDLKSFNYASTRLKNDKKTVLEHSDKPFVIKYVSDILKDDEEVVLKHTINSHLHHHHHYYDSNNFPFYFASDRLKNDKIFVMKFVKISHVFEYVSDTLKNDKEVIREFVMFNPHNFCFISPILKNDKDFVLGFSNYPDVFRHVSNSLKDDETVAIEFIKSKLITNENDIITQFNYLSKRLRENKEFVLKFCGSCIILERLSQILQDDEDIVYACIMKNYRQFIHASVRLKSNKNFIIHLINKYGSIIEYINYTILMDEDIIYAALNSEYPSCNILNIFRTISIIKNKEIVLSLVTKCGRILKDAPELLKDDYDVVLAAVKNNGWAIYYASLSLQTNKVVFKTAITSVIKSIEISGFNHYQMYNDTYINKEKNKKQESIKEQGIFTYDYICCHVLNVLKTYDNFYVFLYGTIKSQSLQHKLKFNGPHFKIKFMRHIADFLGMVHGPEIITYRNAYKKLLL